MDDREMLELAAKAIGKELLWLSIEGVSPLLKHGPGIRGLGEKWNPLTDDGDALRLAVDLGIEVAPYGSGHIIAAQKTIEPLTLPVGGDKHAATRRAIVLAAAEIGREK